jgi:hypothetical protein
MWEGEVLSLETCKGQVRPIALYCALSVFESDQVPETMAYHIWNKSREKNHKMRRNDDIVPSAAFVHLLTITSQRLWRNP